MASHLDAEVLKEESKQGRKLVEGIKVPEVEPELEKLQEPPQLILPNTPKHPEPRLEQGEYALDGVYMDVASRVLLLRIAL